MQQVAANIVPVLEDRPKQIKKKTKSFDDLPISLDNARALYGSMIRGKPVPISSVKPEDGTVIVWGEIFGFQEKTTKDGRRKIITFNLTDFTGSYAIKIFEEIQNV
jgi:DNA polymerase III alpha subunit (gram-positive type)